MESPSIVVGGVSRKVHNHHDLMQERRASICQPSSSGVGKVMSLLLCC